MSEGVTKVPTINVQDEKLSFFIGLCLALTSCLFIGASFVIKKVSLIRLGIKGKVRAGSGGYGYLKDWMWWLGLVTMGIGEATNFAAYTLAPASMVTPLGALSVLVSTILASRILKEKLDNVGKIGCILCILGSVVIVVHAPKEEQIESISELLNRVKQSYFLNYGILILVIIFVIIFYLGPRYGNRYVLVYITLCSCIGSITVVACKVLGLIIRECIRSMNRDNVMFGLGLFLIVIFGIVIQMNYLNKSLDIFSTSVVTPVYYVMFTTLVIIASAILFNEWQLMNFTDVLGSICGFLIVFVAVFLLQNFKDYDYKLIS